MNIVNAIFAENENFKYVEVVFAPYTGTKTYTYKTLADVAQGDFVVVETPTNGYQVVLVLVVKKPEEVDFDVNFNYKWVVDKVDFTDYQKSVAAEREIKQAVTLTKAKKAMREVRENLYNSMDASTVEEVVKLSRL